MRYIIRERRIAPRLVSTVLWCPTDFNCLCTLSLSIVQHRSSLGVHSTAWPLPSSDQLPQEEFFYGGGIQQVKGGKNATILLSWFVNASGNGAARHEDDEAMIREEQLHVSMDHHQGVSEKDTKSRLHSSSTGCTRRAALSEDAVQPPLPRTEKCLTIAQKA